MYCFRAVIIKVFDGSRASGRCNGNGVNGRMPRLLDGLAETYKMRRENAGSDSLVNLYAAESAGYSSLWMRLTCRPCTLSQHPTQP